jgi:hypothetical protein
LKPFERQHRARHALAIADAAFAANLNFKNGFVKAVIVDDLRVSKLKLPGFIGPEAAVDHEQDESMELFAPAFVSDLARFLRAFARRLVQLFVFLRRERCALIGRSGRSGRAGCGAARGQPGLSNEDGLGRNLQCEIKSRPRERLAG